MYESLISVIVPVYNVEKYIYKCVDSIKNQTYKNLEIILVDDGSPDVCGEICDEYTKTDVRVIVIHKENGGLSDARNAGIDIAKGEYLLFVDSDDYISEDCIESLYNAAITDGSDCAITNTLLIYDSNKSKKMFNVKNEYLILTNAEALCELLYQNKTQTAACGKLFKATLFDKIRFPVNMLFEDLATIYKIFYICKRVSIIPEEKYYYIQRTDGIIGSPFDDRKLDVIKITEEIIEFTKKSIPECYKAAVCRNVRAGFYILLLLSKKNKNHLDIRKKIEASIKKYRRIVINDKRAGRKARIACLLSLFGFWLLNVQRFIVKNLLRRRKLN